MKNSGPKKIRDNTAKRSYCARSLSFYRELPSYSEASGRSPQCPQSTFRALFAGLFCASVFSLSACQADTPDAPERRAGEVTATTTPAIVRSSSSPSPKTADATRQLTPVSLDDELTVLVFGDSISAAYGIEREDGWAALLQERLSVAYSNARAINASVSGETTQGGRARLQAALTRHQPDLVYIELGGNDALRGYPVSQMTENLTIMVTTAQQSGAVVVLLGMQIPPNYGPRYTRDFAAAFTEVATATGAHLVPFFLEGVALEANMIQSDGIHPTTLAQPILLDTGWLALVETLGERYPALAKVAP